MPILNTRLILDGPARIVPNPGVARQLPDRLRHGYKAVEFLYIDCGRCQRLRECFKSLLAIGNLNFGGDRKTSPLRRYSLQILQYLKR